MSVAAALDLLSRLPPGRVAQHLDRIRALQPELAGSLRDRVEPPLVICECPSTRRRFVGCKHSEDKGTFRSPWALEVPGGTAHLREMELLANALFQAYSEACYGPAAVASAYFWDVDATAGFAGVVVIHHFLEEGGAQAEDAEHEVHDSDDDCATPTVRVGHWDAVHDVTVEERDPDDRTFRYTVASRVRVHLAGAETQGCSFEFSAELDGIEEVEHTAEGEEDHLAALGDLVQASEGRLRLTLQQISWGKAQDIARELRCRATQSARAAQLELSHVLAATFAERAKNAHVESPL